MEKTDLVAKGWGRHFSKRTKTITLVSERKPCPWEKAVGFARRCQTWIRPPYAWNKPAMFELKIVVQIPERFKNAKVIFGNKPSGTTLDLNPYGYTVLELSEENR
jgi:hypothetical protein